MRDHVRYGLLAWIYAACLAIHSLGAGAQEVFADTLDVRAAFSQLLGDWRGSLTYIDYSNGNEYEIPLATRQESNPDRTALVSWNAFTDPGHIVHTVDVTTVNAEQGTVTVAGFRDGEATMLEYRVAQFEPSADGWRLVLARDGLDDGRQAVITRTLVLEGDRFTARKRVRFADEQTSFERNRVRLERAETVGVP